VAVVDSVTMAVGVDRFVSLRVEMLIFVS